MLARCVCRAVCEPMGRYDAGGPMGRYGASRPMGRYDAGRPMGRYGAGRPMGCCVALGVGQLGRAHETEYTGRDFAPPT